MFYHHPTSYFITFITKTFITTFLSFAQPRSGVRDQGVRDQGVRDQGVRDQRDQRDQGVRDQLTLQRGLRVNVGDHGISQEFTVKRTTLLYTVDLGPETVGSQKLFKRAQL